MKIKQNQHHNHANKQSGANGSTKLTKKERKALNHAVIYTVFCAKGRKNYNIFMAVCSDGQTPWNYLNFGIRLDKETFLSQIKEMKITG